MIERAVSDELKTAIDDLDDALRRAAEASERIRALAPRVERLSTVFNELQSIFQAQGPRPDEPAPAQPPSRTAPAPATSEKLAPRERLRPLQAPALDALPPVAHDQAPWTDPSPTAPVAASHTDDLPIATCRLRFESGGGRLDLRAVDEAVTGHPAVRDVALLDYDGGQATLKVWIVASVSPAELQQALAAHAQSLGSDVAIVALEDAA